MEADSKDMKYHVSQLRISIFKLVSQTEKKYNRKVKHKSIFYHSEELTHLILSKILQIIC